MKNTSPLRFKRIGMMEKLLAKLADELVQTLNDIQSARCSHTIYNNQYDDMVATARSLFDRVQRKSARFERLAGRPAFVSKKLRERLIR